MLAAGADLLDGTVSTSTALENAQSALHDALEALEREAIARAPLTEAPDASSGDPGSANADSSSEQSVDEAVDVFVNSLEPGFRTQELGSSVALVGTNIDVATAADQRGWLDTLVGNQPGVKSARFRSALERTTAHLDWRSVWMHNSVRGAMGLAIAVLIAKEAGLQHSFWVILGTLSVLRSSAVNTGQNALRAVSGTVIGFVIGAAILALVGNNVTVLWFLFPLAVLVAGFAPTALSFAAGQAGFTLTLVILYNLLQPIGWRVGLYRVEDVAIGCVVSVGVGLLFWPSGAAKVLSATLRRAFFDSGAYLVAAVTFDTTRAKGDPKSPGSPERQRTDAAASGRRLDDAFRTYLAERGSKPLPLAEVTALVRGVAYLRQSADAVVELWTHHDATGGSHASTRADLTREATEVQRWYEALGASLTGQGPIPVPTQGGPETDQALRRAVREDLRVHGGASSSSVRLVWTKDYLDAARRLESSLVAPAQVAVSSKP